MTRKAEPITILVVEDDTALRELVREELEEAGYAVTEAGDVPEAVRRLHDAVPALVVSDLRLPGADGLTLLEHLPELPMRPGFIVITAFGTIEQAVEALKRGADDFLTKPLQLEHLRLSVERTLERQTLQQEVARYRRLLGNDHFHGIVGRSTPMRRLFEQIRRTARAAGPVLVLGESGTGKELVARAVHAESERADGPFVAVNCAGIPPDLLESELFGHAAGAFTGARTGRKGLFAEAEGGTLLLDEIGEMPAAMQSKLLRILQDGRVRPVGENRERRLDVRVVAATHRDIEADVETGRFRADLFYRMETFALTVPPLRERGDDIDLLTARLISRHADAAGREVHGITPAALDLMRHYDFPGNVRELANAIERAVAFCNEGQIEIADLPGRIRRGAAPETVASEGGFRPVPDERRLPALETVAQRYVRFVLERVGHNKRQAAQVLGIGRRTLYRYLERDG